MKNKIKLKPKTVEMIIDISIALMCLVIMFYINMVVSLTFGLIAYTYMKLKQRVIKLENEKKETKQEDSSDSV
jgi:ABC-type bacteriocin/lantibiotic exporter with double-glycine peptidase domain